MCCFKARVEFKQGVILNRGFLFQALGSGERDAAANEHRERFHLHGHTLRAKVHLEGSQLPEPGVAVDKAVIRLVDENPVGNGLAIVDKTPAFDLAHFKLLVENRTSGCERCAGSRGEKQVQSRFIGGG